MDRSTTWPSSAAGGAVVPTGVTGKEYVLLVDTGDWNTLVKEKVREVEGLLVVCCGVGCGGGRGSSEDGAPGTRRLTFSASAMGLLLVLVLRLLCGRRPLKDGLLLVECGLGGRPDLADPGLCNEEEEGMVVTRADVEDGVSSDLVGICSVGRFGLRRWCCCGTGRISGSMAPLWLRASWPG